ncbi:MAG: HIT family protein [Bacteroidetes bacterium]|jgi:histidine triad (HIT) family protein|nr:HIT family protein [Bacteroidota bacterium]MCL5034843.1 HIT family protein [Bacteroidota bacterium]
MHQESCPFCRIIEGYADAEILFEGPDSVAFLDIKPINFGHALVVSREHYTGFLELPEKVLDDLTHTLNIVSRAIVGSVRPAGFNIFNNNGVAAGQSVFHFHFHIAPRFDGDGLKIRPRVKVYESPEHMAEYAKMIRDKINVNYKLGEQNESL